MSKLTRRGLLGGGLAGIFAPTLSRASAAPKRSLRVAHMTDFHVQPELNAEKGMELALRHALGQRPDLLLCGGDLVMDAVSQTEQRTTTEWAIFNRLIKASGGIPTHYALGNHDVWGWNKKDSHTTGSELKWGKKWFLDNFGYASTYQSFDQAGWHFVILDNIWQTPDGFNGILGQEQLEWLDHDLAQTNKPTLLLSHIPLLSVTTFVDSYSENTGEWNVGGSDMTKDLDQARKLFEKHPHVKIALSGHEHRLDRVDYKGVSYLCSGAVCGNWWKGPLEGFPPGYRLLDLFHDGTFTERYVPWGWDESFLS